MNFTGNGDAVMPKENISVAVIEFVYSNDSWKDLSYEFYCNTDECAFRPMGLPAEIDKQYLDREFLIDRCGSACKIERKSFFDVFNSHEGSIDIYPVGKNNASYSYYSVYKIKEFYEREAWKYGVKLSMNLDVKGPYMILNKPPKRGRSDGTEKLEEFFDAEANKQNINISQYDVVNYAYFASEEYLVSTADSKKKTYNQAMITFDYIKRSISGIAHEMGHIFRAGDTYTVTSSFTSVCNYPEGYPEPKKKPLYPQNYGCLMCESVMTEENKTEEPNLDRLVVCDFEAKMFGWI